MVNRSLDFRQKSNFGSIAIGSRKVFEIEIGIAISISNEDRDRDCDLNFGDRGHALVQHSTHL